MYTIVTKDSYTGTGYPNAYMFTNNHSAGPIKEWLSFLCDQYGLLVEHITIDCCIAEVNAINAVFSMASIHYCAFHVIRSWNYNLKEKVHNPLYEEDQLQQHHSNMLSALKDIMRDTDIDLTYRAIEQFKTDFYGDERFLDYFQEFWEPDHIIQRWSYAYMDQRNRSFASNAFIESWHNQLKSVYLKDVCNQRFDHLIFVLINDVKFYFKQERDRIMSNNGRIGPV